MLTAKHFALGPVAETLLHARHPADASRTTLMGKDDSHSNQVSVSPGFAVLVFRVAGKCYLPVKWHVGCFFPGWFCVEAHAVLEGS